MMQIQDRFKVHSKFIAPRLGMLKSLDKFDSGFFKIAPTQVDFMDPQQRMLLEVVLEAMIDSGEVKFKKDLMRNYKIFPRLTLRN